MSETESKIKVVCPNCSTKQFVDADRAFTKTFCESCSVRFTIPKLFGKILLHDVISNDEFSTTYNATQLEEGHKCHLRIFDEKISKNESILNALKEQIYKVKKINNKAICKVLSYGFVGNDFFIETEADDNGSLKSRIMNEKISQRAALQYSISLIECLKDISRSELILGNIKTSTLRCLPDRRIRLDDCGFTWTVASLLSQTHKSIEAINNHNYAAPETIKELETSPKSDLYAAGCVIYELLCKIAPFEEKETPKKIYKAHLEEEAISIIKRKPTIPAEINTMAMKMIAKNSNDRPDDLKQLIDCFAINLKHVEEVRVDEIKREFDMPDPSQTLRPRPPTEIDLDIFSGISKEETQNNQNTETVAVDKEATNTDHLLDPNIKDVEPDIKLQDTAVNMQDFEDLEAAYNSRQNFKMLIIAIIIVVIIVASGLLFVFNSGHINNTPTAPENINPETESTVPQLKSRE